MNVPPECLQTIYQFMKENPTIGIAGPQMLGTDDRIGRSYMRFPGVWNCFCRALFLDVIFTRSRLLRGVLMTDFDNGKTADVDVLNGWFLVVRREALERVGLLDENFFMYGEDIDWSYRFHTAGWRRVYFAGARALHYGGASSAQSSTRFYVQMHKANLQYWRKHHGWPGVLGYWLTILIHHTLRVGAYSVLCVCKRGSQIEASYKVRRSAACIAWLIGSPRAQT